MAVFHVVMALLNTVCLPASVLDLGTVVEQAWYLVVLLKWLKSLECSASTKRPQACGWAQCMFPSGSTHVHTHAPIQNPPWPLFLHARYFQVSLDWSLKQCASSYCPSLHILVPLITLVISTVECNNMEAWRVSMQFCSVLMHRDAS